MTLRTGTSRRGPVYCCYSCSAAARLGKTACKGQSIRTDKLDGMVAEEMSERLFTTERLSAIPTSLVRRRVEQSKEIGRRLSALRSEADEADQRLKRLYTMVEDGLADIDAVLGERVKALQAERQRALDALERACVQALPVLNISPDLAARFAATMREKIAVGPIELRKAYLRSVLDRIEVAEDRIRIIGSNDVLAAAMVGKAQPQRGFVVLYASGAP